MRTLHHCVAVSACSSAPSALQTRAELAIKCDKKKHPIWPSRSRIKGSCCCGFHRLHSTIHLLLREEKRNERLEGTDLQADVTEDILYCCTHTERPCQPNTGTLSFILNSFFNRAGKVKQTTQPPSVTHRTQKSATELHEHTLSRICLTSTTLFFRLL